MGNKLLLLFQSLLIGSCVSISTMDIQVLEPAARPLTPYLGSAAIVGRIHSATIENDSQKEWVESMEMEVTREILQSLFFILNESPGMEFLETDPVMLELAYPSRKEAPEPIDPDTIIYLCSNSDVFGVLSLEFFRMQYQDTIILRRGDRETSWYDYYYGEVDVIITAMWRAYAADGYPVDEFNFTDTLSWNYAALTRQLLVHYLPSPGEAFLEAAYVTALAYARSIAPYWMEEERIYFSRGNRHMRRASGHIRNNELDQAETILLRLLDSRNTNTVAAAYMNLALVYELTGNYREALVAARNSYQYRIHPLFSEYIQILEERLEKSHELDRQMGRIN
jgi:tetratricopeptide (TPR) repeat protein